MKSKEWLVERIAYLKYLGEQLHSPLSFPDWVFHTMGAVSRAHSKIHIKANNLKQLIKGYIKNDS